MAPEAKSLSDVLTEHTTRERDRVGRPWLTFTASGNVYREHVYPDNRVFVPIIDGIARDDLRIDARPYDAIAALLKREHILQ